ncbi:MAG: cobalamin-independent methionine synthase II family protein [Verrucomicrobiota bacterium]
MRHSTDRILTTHVGSLPRPHDLLDVLKQKLSGEGFDEQAFSDKLTDSVEGCVRNQAESGIDIVADGEMSKPGHAVYINERLEGFQPDPDVDLRHFAKEKETFPEYYEEYFQRAMQGGAIAPSVPMSCQGPISYSGHEALKVDLENLRAAADKLGCEEAFMPCSAVTCVGVNKYYKSDEEYMFALADALAEEHKAIIDAGFLLQVDDPFMPLIYIDETLTDKEREAKASLCVEAINHSLKDIPEEKVRFHTCYGINQGPRIHEPDLPMIIHQVLKINACGYSFEAGNARHEHEYKLWDDVKLPEGKILIPGVVTHACTVVEHPEYVAERIIRFAERVGRENVIAAPDCGFSSQAMYKTEVHPKIVWAKFRAMSEGAKLASEKLWN